MTSKSHGNRSVPSVLKKENDWEVVSYDTAEQVAVSDPLNDPLNNVGLNSMINAEKNKSPESEPVIKLEILEQENSGHENSGHENSGHENSEQEISGQEINTASPYFMSEVTNDTATEGEATNHAEQSEAVEVVPVEVVPDCSWEARNESNNDDDNVIDIEEHDISEEYDNSTRENVFVDIDYNGIASSDSDSKDDGDNDYDSDVSFGKRKKPKKSPQKNINKKCKLTSSDNNEKCKLTSTESVPFGSNKIEILNNPESIYIPNGWTRRVFQRLTGKYPGKLDVFYIEPKGKKFRSKIDIIRYYSDHNLKLDIDVQAMCFGFGQPGGLPVIPDHLKRPNDALITKAPTKPRTPSSNISNNKKHYNKRKYEMEISAHNTAVSTLCERLSVENVTVEYSEEDFVNLTNHQVYTEYISAMLESENPEVPASAISEVAEAKWKQFLSIKESKTVPKDDKVSQEVLDFLNDDNHDEPDDDRDEDYKDDAADSNDSDYATNPQKISPIERPFKCNGCPNAYTSMKSLKRHIREKNNHGDEINVKPFLCLICKQESLTPEMYRRHLVTHGIGADGQERRFKRDLTLKKMKDKLTNNTNNHDIKEFVKKEPYKQKRQCELCDYVAHRRDAFDVHMRRHTGERPFTCSSCGYSAISKTAMIIHERIHEEDKRYKCTICDYCCVQAGSLKVHMRTHNNDKPYMCTECGHKCTTNGNLKLHMRKHSNKKDFVCSFCGTKFSQKSSLNLHVKTFHDDDTPEKDYLCYHCGHGSSSAAGLKSHMKTHTGEKKYKCLECDKNFTQKGSLTVHMRKHTGEKPFKCSVCAYKCTTKGNLFKHQLKHNKNRQRKDDSEDSDYDETFDDIALFSYLATEEKHDIDAISRNKENEVSDDEEKIDASALCEVQTTEGGNDNYNKPIIRDNEDSDYEEKFDASAQCSYPSTEENKDKNTKENNIIAASLLEHIQHVSENVKNITA